MSGKDERSVSDLLQSLLDNPEDILDESKVSVEQLIELQKQTNPYAFIAGQKPDDTTKKVAVISCTNLREKYLRRFLMTSLVGFLFQMEKEWEVPAELRRWKPAEHRHKSTSAATKSAADALGDTSTSPFDSTKLELELKKNHGLSELIILATKNVKNLTDRRDKTRTDIKTEEAVQEKDKEKSEDHKKLELLEKALDDEIEQQMAQIVGLKCALTRNLTKLGKDAENRLDSSIKEAYKYPAAKEILVKANVKPGDAKQLEIPPVVAKKVIEGFLKNFFEYDPTIHVKSAHDGKNIVTDADPERVAPEILREPVRVPPDLKSEIAILSTDASTLGAARAVLCNPEIVPAIRRLLDEPEKFRPLILPIGTESKARPAIDVVPPEDTFHRWEFYTNVNYEELRTVVQSLYGEKPDFEWAIAPWEMYQGSEKEVNEKFERFCKKHEDNAPSSFHALDFGAWTLMGSFKQNRDRLTYYNAKTAIIKRIMERHEEDERLGADLMRKRVKVEKAKNIREAGPDAPGLKEYRAAGDQLSGAGAERVISPEEMKRLNAARGDLRAAKELEHLDKLVTDITPLEEKRKKGGTLDEKETKDHERLSKQIEAAREMLRVPEDAIQVNVFTHDTATGEFRKTHFYTEAETEEETQQKAELKKALAEGKTPEKSAQLAPYAQELMERMSSEVGSSGTAAASKEPKAAKALTAPQAASGAVKALTGPIVSSGMSLGGEKR